MNRREFIEELKRLLSGASEEDQREALQYYEEYFDDAGIGEEEEVPSKLGTPLEVAGQIQATLQGEEQLYEYGESGYHSNMQGEKQGVSIVREGTSHKEPTVKAKNHTVLIVVLVILAILGFPIWFSVVITLVAVVLVLLATVFGLAIGVIATLLALVVAGVALVGSGIALIVVGCMAIFKIPLAAICMIGIGCLITGVSLFVSIGIIWIVRYAIPAIVKGVIWLCVQPFKLFKKGEK